MNPTFLSDLDPEVLDRIRMSRREAVAKAARAGLGAAIVGSLPVAFGLSAQAAYGQATPATVLDVLNYALTLEYLESDFYTRVKALPIFTSASFNDRDRAYINVIQRHEAAHVEVLKAAISAAGGTPVSKPTFDFTAKGAFPDWQTNRTTLFTLALAFEDTGVRAYKGQAANLIGASSVTISGVGAVNPLTAALQIHAIEARHAAAIRRALPAANAPKGWITGNTGAPAAVYAGEDNVTQGGVNTSTFGFSAALASESFDEPLTKEQVLAIVTPFIA